MTQAAASSPDRLEPQGREGRLREALKTLLHAGSVPMTESADRTADAILRASAVYEIPVSYQMAMIHQESRFDVGAHSNAGAIGLGAVSTSVAAGSVTINTASGAVTTSTVAGSTFATGVTVAATGTASVTTGLYTTGATLTFAAGATAIAYKVIEAMRAPFKLSDGSAFDDRIINDFFKYFTEFFFIRD